MAVATNQNFRRFGACLVVKVTGITDSLGGGDWIPAAAKGYTAAKILVVAETNPGAIVAPSFEGAADKLGEGSGLIEASTAFHDLASITAAGVASVGSLQGLPPYIRPLEHGDATGILTYYICLFR